MAGQCRSDSGTGHKQTKTGHHRVIWWEITMKKRIIWFCVVMVTITGEQEILMQTTNREEAQENIDILQSVETSYEISYQLGKVLG